MIPFFGRPARKDEGNFLDWVGPIFIQEIQYKIKAQERKVDFGERKFLFRPLN